MFPGLFKKLSELDNEKFCCLSFLTVFSYLINFFFQSEESEKTVVGRMVNFLKSNGRATLDQSSV